MSLVPFGPAPRPLRWALYSKHPHRHEDYGVLASTPGVDAMELALLIRRASPGNPRQTAPGQEPPWFTFTGSGEHATAGERLGLSVLEWRVDEAGRRLVDGTGRPIMATRYFDLAFESPASQQTGYFQLYWAVGGLPLPLPQGVAAVPVQPANTGDLVADIKFFGFEWLATVAALLLDKPVMIVGERPPPVVERVRCLDAVAALLPYGFRADLVAGTWTSNAGVHQIHVGFAERATDQQFAVTYRQLPVMPELTPSTAKYLDQLKRLQQHNGTAWLVERLWKHTTPLAAGSEPAEAALRELEMEDPAFSVYIKIKSGRVVPGQARQALMSGDPRAAEPEIRSGLLRQVAADGSDQDLELLDRHWSAEVQGYLADEVLGVAPEERCVRFIDLVARHAELDRFRAGVVRAVLPREPEARTRMARIVAASPPPAEGGEAELRDLVLHDQPLCLELAVTAVERHIDNAPQWLRWLTTGRTEPRWIQPFAVAAGVHPGPPNPSDVRSIALWGARNLRAVVALAAVCETVPATLRGLAQELLPLAEDADGRAPLVALLGTLAPQPAATQAAIDVLLAAFESFPMPRAAVDDPDAYATAAADLLRHCSGPDLRRVAAVQLVHGLTSTDHQRAGVIVAGGLADRLRPDKLYRQVLGSVLSVVEATPALLFELSPAVQAELVDMSPTLRVRSVLERIASSSAAESPDDDDLVALWIQAIELQCAAVDILQQMAPTVAPEHVLVLVEDLVVTLSGTAPRTAGQIALDVHEAMLGGAMGEDAAIEYRSLLETSEEPARLHWQAISRSLHSTIVQRVFRRPQRGRPRPRSEG